MFVLPTGVRRGREGAELERQLLIDRRLREQELRRAKMQAIADAEKRAERRRKMPMPNLAPGITRDMLMSGRGYGR